MPQKKHYRYEFYFNASGSSAVGATLRDVFNAIPADENRGFGATYKMRAKQALKAYGLEFENLPGDEDATLDEFFLRLEAANVGSWRWYDSLIGEAWRFVPQKNDLVLRKGAKGIPRRFSADAIDALRENVRRAHDYQRRNAEVVSLHLHESSLNLMLFETPEERVERLAKAKSGIKEFWDSMTPERKAEMMRKRQEAYERRRACCAMEREMQERECEKVPVPSLDVPGWAVSLDMRIGSCSALVSSASCPPIRVDWNWRAYMACMNGREDWVEINSCGEKRYCLRDSREYSHCLKEEDVNGIYAAVSRRLGEYWHAHPLASFVANYKPSNKHKG